MSRFRSILLVVIILVSSGCAGRQAARTDTAIDMPDTFTASLQQEARQEIRQEIRWWEIFNDAQLNTLMNDAFKNNLDLKSAFQRLSQIRSVARITGASRLPAVNLGATAGRLRQQGFMGADTNDSYRLSVAATYEIDVWRKLDARSRASALEVLVSRETIKSLYISLSAELAETYYSAVEQRAQLELIEKTISSFEDTLMRVRLRYRQGLVPALDIYQSRQNLARAKAGKPLFKSALSQSLHRLSLLLGRFPERSIGGEQNTLPEPPMFPAGLPAELITQRPDIQAALLRIAASDERVAEAVAARFPSFNLTASYGGASDRLRSVLESPNIFWNLLMDVAMPLFDAGRRKEEVSRTESVVRENVLLYHQTVLRAFKEVEDALVMGHALEIRIRMLAEATDAAENAHRLALERYQQGLADYLPVLNSQQALFDSRSAYLSAQHQLISNRIQLARALGGTWAGDIMDDLANSDTSGEDIK